VVTQRGYLAVIHSFDPHTLFLPPTMHCKSSLLLLVTLAASTLATPLPAEDNKTIPLRKRAAFTMVNGVFDRDAYLSKAVIVKNKHRQNLINLKKNMGVATFSKIKVLYCQFIKAFC
jgi:hypothetical protein